MAKFTWIQLCWYLFLSRNWRPGTLLKIGSGTAVFLWILSIFKNTYLAEQLWTAVNEVRNTEWLTDPVHPKKNNSKTSIQKEVLWENMFLGALKLFVFEFQVLNNCFTGQLPLNAFTCYFENFLRITTNIVNSQVIPLQALLWLLCSLCQKTCQTYFLS